MPVNDAFCPMLWTNHRINLKYAGSNWAAPCCQFRGQPADGFGYNNSVNREVRRHIMEGKRHPGCVQCWEDEASNRESLRLETIRKYPNVGIEMTDSDGTTQKLPVRLDIKFDNPCNLKCRMCNPNASNQIEKEFDQLKLEYPEFKHFGKFSKAPYLTLDELLEDVGQYWSGLEKLCLIGGETFYNAKAFKVVKHCVESGHANHIQLMLTTNATVFPDHWIEVLSHFRAIQITVSVDGLGEVFEYIRYPAQWDVVEQNIARISEVVPDFDISFTPQTYNVYDLFVFLDWCKQFHSSPHNWLNPSWLHDPTFLNMRHIPDHHKDALIRDIEAKRTQYIHPLEDDLISGVLADLRKPRDPTEWEKFRQYTEILDKKRNQRLQQSIPEVYRLLAL